MHHQGLRILTKNLKHPISNADFKYIYIRIGVATVHKFCTYIYVQKSESVNFSIK